MWPFVAGFANTSVVAVPFEEAIRMPFLPTVLLEGASIAAAKILLRNNELVRQCNQDYDRQTAQADEAMAKLLREEEAEPKVPKARRNRKNRTKGRQTITIEATAKEVAPTEESSTEETEDAVPCSTTSDPPPEAMCPITHELMKDPVVICDGYTFERKSIESWFQRSSTNPMTGLRVANIALIPNINLRILCQSYRDGSSA